MEWGSSGVMGEQRSLISLPVGCNQAALKGGGHTLSETGPHAG